jgi:hypothetical protein
MFTSFHWPAPASRTNSVKEARVAGVILYQQDANAVQVHAQARTRSSRRTQRSANLREPGARPTRKNGDRQRSFRAVGIEHSPRSSGARKFEACHHISEGGKNGDGAEIYCCCCSVEWSPSTRGSWSTADQSSDSISVSGGGGLSEGATRTATVSSLEASPLNTPRVGGTSA